MLHILCVSLPSNPAPNELSASKASSMPLTFDPLLIVEALNRCLGFVRRLCRLRISSLRGKDTFCSLWHVPPCWLECLKFGDSICFSGNLRSGRKHCIYWLALDNTSLILGDWDKSKQRGDICWGIRMGQGRNGEKGTTLWVWDIHLGRKTV